MHYMTPVVMTISEGSPYYTCGHHPTVYPCRSKKEARETLHKLYKSSLRYAKKEQRKNPELNVEIEEYLDKENRYAYLELSIYNFDKDKTERYVFEWNIGHRVGIK